MDGNLHIRSQNPGIHLGPVTDTLHTVSQYDYDTQRSEEHKYNTVMLFCFVVALT